MDRRICKVRGSQALVAVLHRHDSAACSDAVAKALEQAFMQGKFEFGSTLDPMTVQQQLDEVDKHFCQTSTRGGLLKFKLTKTCHAECTSIWPPAFGEQKFRFAKVLLQAYPRAGILCHNGLDRGEQGNCRQH